MTIGKFKGQPVESMTTGYLAWLVTRDNIRFKHWPLVEEALRILRSRFDDFGALVAELRVDAPPPEYWKTPERVARKANEKAEKLRRLETLRAEEKARRRAELRARHAQRQAERQPQRPAQVNTEPPPGVLLDASYYVRQVRQKRPEPDDVSDLV